MKKTGDILLLAGSAEAHQIAAALQARGYGVRGLMSEPPRGPEVMPGLIPVAFELCPGVTSAQIAEAAQGAVAIVDASHGFDAAMRLAGVAAADVLGLPFLTVLCPAWDVAEDALWCRAADVAAAMALIGPGARVFSAAGWGSLASCADFPGALLMLRQTVVHQKPVPFEFVELVFGTAPFSVAQEVALFRERRVDVLMVRNLGGVPSRPKLEAAKELGLKVILIDRPPLPEGVEVVQDVEAALAWVKGL